MSQPTETVKSPWTRPAFIASALIVGFLVMAFLAQLVWRSLDRGTAPAPSASAAASPDTRPCPAAPLGDMEAVLHAPTRTTWTPGQGGAMLPAVPASGPSIVEATGFRRCFAHSAEGALVAAANVYSMTFDPTLRARVLEWSFEPSAGTERAKKEYQDRLRSPTEEPNLNMHVAGFFVAPPASDDQIDVDLAIEVGTKGDYVLQRLTLVWYQGDWRVRVFDNGQFEQLLTLSSLDGYVRWPEE